MGHPPAREHASQRRHNSCIAEKFRKWHLRYRDSGDILFFRRPCGQFRRGFSLAASPEKISSNTWTCSYPPPHFLQVRIIKKLLAPATRVLVPTVSSALRPTVNTRGSSQQRMKFWLRSVRTKWFWSVRRFPGPNFLRGCKQQPRSGPNATGCTYRLAGPRRVGFCERNLAPLPRAIQLFYRGSKEGLPMRTCRNV